jgi:nitrous-oxide reductase
LKGELIALSLLLLVLGATLVGLNHLDSTYREWDRAITLTAQVPDKGGWEPRIIRVRVGQLVRLRLTSRDVTHGFLLPDFNIKAGPISPGEFTTVEFVADKAGTFTFYCNILCSRRHGSMNGRLIVVEGP